MSGSLSQQIAPHLPYLRRYARALAGSQKSGDAYVKACLQAIVADASVFDPSLGTKVALYRLFHTLWNATQMPPSEAEGAVSIFEKTTQQRLAAMTPESRQTLLLTTLEGFKPREAATIIGRSEAEV
ncbi:hypothetical protein [Polymorphum gilvum]|uniref:hypothetical protein n=1 Tax=Polymorphum gilvum TaxID=991904 RepID=UPI0026A1BCE4